MSEQKKRGENESKTPKKSNAGRKSKYHTHILPYLELIAQMRRNGVTVEQIAERFKVSIAAFMNYQNQYIELKEVLKANAELAVVAVENALFKNATENNNLTAQIFYLKNRASNRWRDRQHVFQTSTTTVRKDYEHLTDEELEKEMDQLETIVPGDNESNDEYDTDGELH